jgi:hypothetical protein
MYEYHRGDIICENNTRLDLNSRFWRITVVEMRKYEHHRIAKLAEQLEAANIDPKIAEKDTGGRGGDSQGDQAEGESRLAAGSHSQNG